MEARVFHDNQHVNFEAFSISIQGHPSSFLNSRPKVILLHDAMQLNKLTIGTRNISWLFTNSKMLPAHQY